MARHAKARRKAVRTWVREALLTVTAVLGALSIAAVAASLFCGMSLVVFRTGSMAPTIPTGSVAIVREIPATSLRVGDIAMVQRQGAALPVTHRVTGIEPDASTPGGVVLSMKGDNNAAPDPVTYPVTTAREVMFSAPGLGRVLVWFRQPLLLVVMVIAVAALVTWTFWPESSTRPRHPQGAARMGAQPQ